MRMRRETNLSLVLLVLQLALMAVLLRQQGQPQVTAHPKPLVLTPPVQPASHPRTRHRKDDKRQQTWHWDNCGDICTPEQNTDRKYREIVRITKRIVYKLQPELTQLHSSWNKGACQKSWHTSSTSWPNPTGLEMASDISLAISCCSATSSIKSCTSSTSLKDNQLLIAHTPSKHKIWLSLMKLCQLMNRRFSIKANEAEGIQDIITVN